MKIINSVKEIAEKYELFIIDLWGVLHDGIKPYQNAIATLEYLKLSGKKIALLSNAPRRAFVAEQNLENLGFNKNLYDSLTTSGEVTFDYVCKNYSQTKSYYYIGPEKDRSILSDSKLTEVTNPQNADFAIVTGFNGFESTFEERKWQADECLKNKLTLLCANPDRKVVRQTGEVQICAGVLAEYYEQKGGNVKYFGKPYMNAYKNILENFNISHPQKIICIGDSLHTDIKGANNINADSLLIANGILALEILDAKKNINLDNVEKLSQQENCKPTYIIDFFK